MPHFSTRSMNKLLCSMALVLASGSAPLLAVAQQRPASAASQTSAAAAQSTGSPAISTEVALLKTQLEDNRKFQEQLLSTVHWSLGTLASLAALLVGFGWFANFRMYERDRAALERDLRAQLLDELRKASVEASEVATKRFSDQETHLESRSQEHGDRLKEEIKTQVENSETRTATRASAIASDLGSLKRAVLRLELSAILQERTSWINRKVPRNTLQTSVSALELANKIAWENTVGEVLDFVASDMANILTQKANPIDNFLVAQLVAALDSVNGVHGHAAAGLKVKAGALLNA